MSAVNAIKNPLLDVETYSSIGKKESVTPASSPEKFLEKVFQSIPKAIEDSREHEKSVGLAAQNKISALDLLENTTRAKLSLSEAQALIKGSLDAVKSVEQIPL